MTYVVGQPFDALTQFPLIHPHAQRRHHSYLIARFTNAHPLPNNMHNLPYPRLLPFLGLHFCHLLCRPPPHFCPSHLPVFRLLFLAAKRLETVRSSKTRQPRSSFRRRRQSLQRTSIRTTLADDMLTRLNQASKKLNAVWGATSTAAQFVIMAMFIQGFWLGPKLVRDGKIGARVVMAVFWACLIATSNLQMCIPQFITLAKGKFAIVSLLTLLDALAPPRT